MTASQEKFAQYRATAYARQRLAGKQIAEQLARAKLVAQQAATFLQTHYSVAQVAVFGSVVHPARFHTRSDIDLAVWGMNEHDYYRAVGELQAISSEFAIDLVRVEDVSLPLQQTIIQESMPL
ncbi:MAG: hypothetical protein KF832_06480 [Caldilineaceae bacterium]|nr:hypothetical protein [Caldilineaceae bacterium]